MWLHVPEAPPDVREGDLAVLSVCTGGAMLEEGVAAAVEYALGRRAVTVGYCERQAGSAAALVARMADAGLDPAPVWDDLDTLPCELWRGHVALVTAGIPCQPWSGAGARLGLRDPRWLWPRLRTVLCDVGAGGLILENVAGFITPVDLAADGFPGWVLPAGLGVILGDLAEMGWDAEWVCLPAAAVGAHHLRWRVFLGAAPRANAFGRRCRKGTRWSQDTEQATPSGTTWPRTAGKRLPPQKPSRPRPDAESLRRPQTVGGEPHAKRSHAPDPPRPDAEDAFRRGELPAQGTGSGRPGPAGGRGSRAHAESGDGRLLLSGREPREAGPELERRGPIRPDAGSVRRSQGPEDVRSREPVAAARGGGPGPDAESVGKRAAHEKPPAVREARPRPSAERDCRRRPGPGPLPQLPFFALPPQNCRAWQGSSLVEPAVEPGFCVSVHGMALVVDEDRVPQLRTSGNGVVALQAAVAVVALLERLGLTATEKKQGCTG